MAGREVSLYHRACSRVRDRFSGRVAVKIGLEMDYDPETFPEARRIAETFAFDVLAGSVHFLGPHNLVSRRERARMPLSPAGQVTKYLELLFAMLDERFFDVVGHPDMVKKFHGPDMPGLAEAREEMARRMAEARVAAEVNTSGLSHPVGEIYPGPGLLAALARHGVPVTLGSDAHRPEEVGREFGRAARELRLAGFDRITTFSRRRPLAVNLAPCLENPT